MKLATMKTSLLMQILQKIIVIKKKDKDYQLLLSMEKIQKKEEIQIMVKKQKILIKILENLYQRKQQEIVEIMVK